MKIFSMDSPLMQGLGKMADLMLLNVIALICCIPVITIGASLTALYYMALKIVRNEEVYIFKGFWNSFKQNLKQATVVWLIQLVVMFILYLDYKVTFGNPDMTFPLPIQVIVLVTAVVLIAIFIFIYPVMSKFDNTLKDTFKNTFLMVFMQMPKIIVMAVLWILPLVVAIFAFQLFPLVVLFGMSLPAYLSAMMYNKFFKKMEDRMIERAIEAGEMPADPGSEDEHIFSDVLDPALQDKASDKRNK